ncbi:MAG TPA: DUF2490 domain-containing protein [Phycisphaerales bacterium]|nr:DUF2490 domain-containing protein [Phycisphaerales bacterium]
MRVRPITGLHRTAAHLIVAIVFAAPFGRDCLAGDFEFWNTTGACFDLDKDWRVRVDELLKLGKDAGELTYHHTDLGFVYQGLADWLDLGLHYRQVFDKDDELGWCRENRPHVNLTVKSRLADIDISDRSRFEYRDKECDPDVWRYTNKLTVRLPHEFTKWKLRPYLADHVYINLEGQAFDGNKIYSGFSFQPSANTRGALYYVWDTDKTDGKWTSTNILWVQLRFYF